MNYTDRKADVIAKRFDDISKISAAYGSDIDAITKHLEHVDDELERINETHYWDNERLVNWLYALTGIVVTMLVVLFILICNIYFRLGVIPDLV